MRRVIGTVLGKSVAKAVKLRGKSSGQSMPGLVVETLVPGYLGVMLGKLPDGVVIITGTNGKTTTTKMVVELLQASGKRVLTNATGSNLTRGIISSVSQQATRTGRLPFDIAVFELDEAYAYQFTNVLRPRYVLALNASRDQLDRFGEVDAVARLISGTMLTATDGIVVNGDDKRLSAAAATADVPVSYFGVDKSLLRYFPRDEELVAVGRHRTIAMTAQNRSVELLSFKDSRAAYRIGGDTITAQLQVTGQHNFQNAAGALALVGLLLPQSSSSILVSWLGSVKPAFGRGQAFRLRNGTQLQLNLVKNPASFRQGLASYVRPSTRVLIAINDGLADSRDMSWLWDVDFSSLQDVTIDATTGVRAVDMALRLQYDDLAVAAVEPDIERALTAFCSLPGDKVVFASYTAMLKLHRMLEQKAGEQL
jgi:lipid II isoglutaminyl synthase (glutamine-hydrolysing)